MFFFLGHIVNNKVLDVYESFKILSNDKTDDKTGDKLDEKPGDTDNGETDENNNLPSVFTTPSKDEQITPEANSSCELFYDFQAENFHAEQVIL